MGLSTAQAEPVDLSGDQYGNLDPPEDDRRLRVVDTAEFIKMKIPERKLLLAPWLTEQAITMIHAYRGLGKTWLALSLAYAVASAGRVLRWSASEAHRTLYIDGEMTAGAMQERLAGIIATSDTEPAPGYLRFITPDLQDGPMPNLATYGGQELIEPFLQDVKLVLIDNISTLCNDGPENDSDSWLSSQEWALSLRRRGIATCFIHHSGKGGAQRGTSKREDVLDTVISLRRPDDYKSEQGARFEVHFEKNRGFAGQDAQPFEAALTAGERGEPIWTVRSLEDQLTARAQELSRQGFSQREIAKELKTSPATVNRRLRAGESQ